MASSHFFLKIKNISLFKLKRHTSLRGSKIGYSSFSFFFLGFSFFLVNSSSINLFYSMLDFYFSTYYMHLSVWMYVWLDQILCILMMQLLFPFKFLFYNNFGCAFTFFISILINFEVFDFVFNNFVETLFLYF